MFRAQKALQLLLIPPAHGSVEAKPAVDYFSQKEIYPGEGNARDRGANLVLLGSKISHFKALHRKTGIPYSEMVCPGLPLRVFLTVL